MFRTAPAAEPSVVMSDMSDIPIPISNLALDLPEPPAGWLAELERRGIEVTVDDIGRRSVPRDVARVLLAEHAAAEARKREAVQRMEAAAIQKDREWRAQLPKGIPWHSLPDAGLLPVVQMTAAAAAERPKRTSVLQDALAGGETVMHILEPQPAFLEDE
jgi:hypothetical protein